ncbi:MAG: carbamate kinase [Deltaproteobacteria bacterium SG8_13]|nr:MAG: carbamate kinase [Deltaproteobacteria bacterium SG8_13]
MGKLAVIAIGGNSLIKDSKRQDVDAQLEAVRETVDCIVEVIADGWEVVISHGNGPQVGFILRRSEIAFACGELHFVPLKNCVADTQGAIGYQIQESLCNALRKRGIPKSAVSVVTLVEVDADDTSFAVPTKPIGAYYSAEKAAELLRQHPEWTMVEDALRGYRRVVPSPAPMRIVELDAIRALVADRFCVIAAGGGGIPVVADTDGNLQGVDAVVDKDMTSSLLATGLGADMLVISTAVDRVYRNYGKPDQSGIDRITAAEARELVNQGHFAAGSMQPKILAAAGFVERGGREAVITNPENLRRAIAHRSGTRIVR